MNNQKTKELRKAVYDWCNGQNLPVHMWNKAWKRFKKLYSSNAKLKRDLDKDPVKTLNEKFTVKRKDNDKKSTPQEHTEA